MFILAVSFLLLVLFIVGGVMVGKVKGLDAVEGGSYGLLTIEVILALLWAFRVLVD